MERPPPRDETFSDHIDVVDVDVRQIRDQRIRGIVRGQTHVLAVEPLESAVRTDVYYGVGRTQQRRR